LPVELIAIGAAAANGAGVANAGDTEPPKEETPPPKQERIIVGGYDSKGNKVSYDEQVADGMQQRIDDLNKKYKNIENEDTEHQDHSQKPKETDKKE
jgi:hypothetical protein